MKNRNGQLDATRVYGLLSCAANCILSLQLYWLGASIGCIATAFFCALAFFTGRLFLRSIVPFVVFATLLAAFVFDRLQPTTLDSFALATTALAAIGVTSGWQRTLSLRPQQATIKSAKVAPSGVEATGQLSASHGISLLFVAIAWLFGGYLISDFQAATSTPESFERYRALLRQSIQLVPWAYCGIKLVIILAALFSIAHGLLSYLRCRSNTGMMAAMLLRHELWKWNSSEQRLIARAVKNRK